MKLFAYVPCLNDGECVPEAVLSVGRRECGRRFGILRLPTPIYDWEVDLMRFGWSLGFRWLHIVWCEELPTQAFLLIIKSRVFRPFTGDS